MFLHWNIVGVVIYCSRIDLKCQIFAMDIQLESNSVFLLSFLRDFVSIHVVFY